MISFIYGFIIGGSSTFFIINGFFRIEKRYQYKWSCDVIGCFFKVETNDDDPELLMDLINTHKEMHVRE